MSRETAVAVTILITVIMLSCVGMMRATRDTLIIRGDIYTVAGMMEQKTDGDTIYIPVYHRSH